MKAVAYIRVSTADQVDGHSLDAQERLFRELCRSREWEPAGVYREEGRSAHVDSIRKRPLFKQLLEDAGKARFDVVVVHTLDRWSRNLKVTIETVSQLAPHNVGLVSITEHIDWSNPQGRLFTQMLGAFAEYYSGALATHVKKGISERALQGRHLGSVPFGYQSCYEKGQLKCEEEHPGGVHIIPSEADAVKELFRRNASSGVTLAQLASWMNSQGFNTRNTKSLPNGSGTASAGPRLFTTASVRGILHNPFYTGKVRHRDELLPGTHEALVSDDVFQQVQLNLRRNSGRSETLSTQPEREYQLKGLIKCVHCLMSLWAQTLKSGSRLYREQARSRSHMDCPADGRSIPCDVPDEQMGRIVSAIVLPEAWMDRVLARVHLADEVKRVQTKRGEIQGRLRRLGEVYVDNLKSREAYLVEKRLLEDELSSLAVPAADAVKEAGKLLEDLPTLWEQANLGERMKLLLTMLDAVYVDTVEEKSIVAIRPKPAFMPLFEVATTREGSDVLLLHEKDLPPVNDGPEATTPWLWWRRGRVELPVQKRP